MKRYRINILLIFFATIAVTGLLGAACNPAAMLVSSRKAADTPSQPPASEATATITLIPSLIPTAASWPTAVPTGSAGTGATAQTSAGTGSTATHLGTQLDMGEHFTMVLMGIDARPGRPNWMTDTMMIFDINPETGQAGLLSIPRDVWFYAETHTRHTTRLEGVPLLQVNRFYALAELAESGTGGEAVKAALQRNMGLKIDAYAVIDFQVFVRLINAIGGVDIVLSKPISDPTFPDMNNGYDPLELPAGPIHMDGSLALRYARTRHPDSDFGRILRQQHLLRAILDKLSRPGVWPQLMQQFPDLWLELRSQIDTDLTLEQVTQLAMLVRDIELDDIAFASLSENGVQIERRVLDNGRQAWILIQSGAIELAREVFHIALAP